MSLTELSKLTKQIKNPTLEAFGHSLAGATAGAFALCLLYPLDQIKVRKAVQSQSRILTFKTIMEDFIHFRIDNIFDIYRGLSFGVFQQFSFNGVYFFFYQLLKSDWQRKYSTLKQTEMPWLTTLIRGSIAGVLTQLFTTPLKVIHVRKQTAALNAKSSVSHIMSHVYDEHGISGFWSGMKASIILVINPAIVQIFYVKIRNYLILKLGHTSVYIDFFAGALSKSIATIICYPLVLIKINLQAGANDDVIDDVYHEYHEKKEGKQINGMIGKKRVSFNGEIKIKQKQSMTDIFDSTIKEKGIFGLYSGLGPKLIQASLTNAITFASKEKFCVYVFAMMLYLQSIKDKGRAMQKMTAAKTKRQF